MEVIGICLKNISDIFIFEIFRVGGQGWGVENEERYKLRIDFIIDFKKYKYSSLLDECFNLINLGDSNYFLGYYLFLVVLNCG